MSVRRDRAEIIKVILEVGKREKHKTHVMYESNLNYAMLSKYYGALSKLGYLEERKVSGFKYLKTTEEGLKALETLKEASAIVKRAEKFL